jgi:hypothetical protein
MPQVGDTELLEVDVYPWDGTTSASFTVVHPDNTTTVHPATPTEVLADVEVDDALQTVAVQRWTSGNLIYDASRQWVIVAIVTGTGAGVQSRTVWVDELPTGGGVPWRPNLARVAAYVPSRTLAVDDTSGTPQLIFDDTTRPTGEQVDRIIDDAVAWVTAGTGDLDAGVYSAATGTAALRAAGFVEITWPIRPEDTNTGQALLTQADAALKALAARNEALTGVNPDDPDAVFEVAYSPACGYRYADCRYDVPDII